MTARLVVSPWLLVLLVSCKKEAPPPPPEPAGASVEPDRLPPGQLLEGDEKVFDLALPVGSTIEAVFQGSASVFGSYAPEDLAAYLKPRLRSSHVEMAGDKIVFPKAEVRGREGRIFRVEIGSFRGGTQLRLRDITPARAEPGLTEEERWRQVGMTPDGRLIDQNSME